jgi:predicted transcriptional regulator YdeE
MDIRTTHADSFRVCGYAVETQLDANNKDLGMLFEKYRDILLAHPESRQTLYGVFEYTTGHRYSYLLGIKCNVPPKEDMVFTDIPAAHFAVASVPDGITEVEAWTHFFEFGLPGLGYAPDAQHGKHFEYYGTGGKRELWTPIINL